MPRVEILKTDLHECGRVSPKQTLYGGQVATCLTINPNLSLILQVDLFTVVLVLELHIRHHVRSSTTCDGSTHRKPQFLYPDSSLIVPQNVIFKNLQQVSIVLSNQLQYALSRFQKTKIVIWLYDNIEMRIEGRIIVCVLRSNFVAHHVHSILHDCFVSSWLLSCRFHLIIH